MFISSSARIVARAKPSTHTIKSRAFTTSSTAHFFSSKKAEVALVKGPRPRRNTGTMEDLLPSSIGNVPILPQRFSDLKKSIFRDELTQSWGEVLAELKTVTEEVASRGPDIIPRVRYEDLINGLNEHQIGEIKRTGCVIVKGGVPKEEALSWKQDVFNYIATNREHVEGVPEEAIVYYEIYNSKPQMAARQHPGIVNTQRALLSLWHVSDPASAVSLSTPVTYFDRLRVRLPGPSTFVLEPHIDSGGLERWEDPGFRSCFKKILEGNWKQHDPFDATPRITAKQDLYGEVHQLSVFRPWNGWVSLSNTGPNQGALRLLPFLSLSTAYLMLRPFFRPKRTARSSSSEVSFAAEDWELDLDTPTFPGTEMGKAQGMDETTHPHLRLDKALVSIPFVEPGDQAYWHGDLIHSVENEHLGKEDSAAIYVPAVPLTDKNYAYLRNQAATFQLGFPPPDFPAGDGESRCKGRAAPDEVTSMDGRRRLGLAPFEIPVNATSSEATLINGINARML